MKTILSMVLVAAGAALAGCAAEGPAAGGASVRALLASQVVPARAHADRGTDGTAAAAAYANYRQSYVAPQPQGDSPLVGTRK